YALVKGRNAPVQFLNSAAPILFRLTLYCWRFRIFDLHPKLRSTRTIGRAEPLRHNALTAELARCSIYGCAVLLEMFVSSLAIALQATPYVFRLALASGPCRSAPANRTRKARHSQVSRDGGLARTPQGRSRRKRWLRRRPNMSEPEACRRPLR